jgi:hypothetical protein
MIQATAYPTEPDHIYLVTDMAFKGQRKGSERDGGAMLLMHGDGVSGCARAIEKSDSKIPLPAKQSLTTLTISLRRSLSPGSMPSRIASVIGIMLAGLLSQNRYGLNISLPRRLSIRKEEPHHCAMPCDEFAEEEKIEGHSPGRPKFLPLLLR